MDDEHFFDFGSIVSSGAVRGAGWSFQEEGFTWTLGTSAVLILPPRPAGEQTRLMIAVRPMLHAGLVHQRVGVVIDGKVLAELTVTDESVVEADIPLPAASAAGDGKPVILTLQLPDATSPTLVGNGNDDRLLGLAVKWVRWGALGAERRRLASSNGRKTIILARHHQAAALASIFNRLPLLQDRYAVVACEPVLDRIREAALGLPEGDLAGIWLQRTSDAPHPDAVRALAPGAPVVTFPFLHMTILWPFAGEDSRLAYEPPLYPRGRYPYPDSAAATVAESASSLSDEALLAAYMVETAERMPDLPAALGAYAGDLVARDRDCDVKLAGFILGTFQATSLFQNQVTPSGPLLAQLAVRLVLQGDVFQANMLGPLLLELERLLVGYVGAVLEETPVHPDLATAYHLRWHRPDLLYRWYDNAWGFADYTVNYIRWAPWAI